MSDRGVACTMERIEIEYEYQPTTKRNINVHHQRKRTTERKSDLQGGQGWDLRSQTGENDTISNPIISYHIIS